jgi:hypothetical protein
MARSIRTMFQLKQHSLNNDNSYDKQIYIRHKNWHPPPTPLYVKDKINEFEKLLKARQHKLIDKNKQRNLLNITPLQKSVMNQL